MEADPREILVVDDDPELLEAISTCLQDLPRVRVVTAGSGGQALEILKVHKVDVILSDFHLPDMSGMELLAAARESAPRARRAMITGSPVPHLSNDAHRVEQVERFFIKPLSMVEFSRGMRTLLDPPRR